MRRVAFGSVPRGPAYPERGLMSRRTNRRVGWSSGTASCVRMSDAGLYPASTPVGFASQAGKIPST